MKLLRLFPLELGRLLHSRMTWLIVLLTVISPAVGLVLYKPAIASTMLSMYLANPALAGGAAGGILFGLLTVYELDRAGRSRVEVLTNAVVSPLAAALVRLPALLAAAGLALVLTMLVWLPISCGLIGSIFDGGDYVLAYLLFMGLALPLSILAASAAYQYTRRADLSLVLFAAFAALSLTVWADNWQLCWLNPCVWALSDDFSNFRIFRSVAWMRLTWLAALAGIWTVSYLCIRQYGKGLPGSLARSVRRAHRPIIALSLLACSGFAYAAQPLVDHSNPDQTVMDFYQVPYAENVVCTSRSAQVFPDTTAGTVSGTAALPVPEHLRAGVDSGLRRQSGLYHLQRAGQRRRSALLCERLSGVQRGHAGGGPPVGPGDRTDYGLRWLSPGKPECVHHAGRHGDQL